MEPGREYVIGVYEGYPVPLNCDVLGILQTEDRPIYGQTGTRRYYVLLVKQNSTSGVVPHGIAMDDYEVSNLRVGLEVLRKIGLDTGDWLGQLLFKLPTVEHAPNQDMDQQMKRLQDYL